MQEFTATSVKRGDKLNTQVKAAYKLDSKWSTALTFVPNGQVRAGFKSRLPLITYRYISPLTRAAWPCTPIVNLYLQVTASVNGSDIAPGLSIGVVGVIPDVHSAKVVSTATCFLSESYLCRLWPLCTATAGLTLLQACHGLQGAET